MNRMSRGRRNELENGICRNTRKTREFLANDTLFLVQSTLFFLLFWSYHRRLDPIFEIFFFCGEFDRGQRSLIGGASPTRGECAQRVQEGRHRGFGKFLVKSMVSCVYLSL